MTNTKFELRINLALLAVLALLGNAPGCDGGIAEPPGKVVVDCLSGRDSGVIMHDGITPETFQSQAYKPIATGANVTINGHSIFLISPIREFQILTHSDQSVEKTPAQPISDFSFDLVCRGKTLDFTDHVKKSDPVSDDTTQPSHRNSVCTLAVGSLVKDFSEPIESVTLSINVPDILGDYSLISHDESILCWPSNPTLRGMISTIAVHSELDQKIIHAFAKAGYSEQTVRRGMLKVDAEALAMTDRDFMIRALESDKNELVKTEDLEAALWGADLQAAWGWGVAWAFKMKLEGHDAIVYRMVRPQTSWPFRVDFCIFNEDGKEISHGYVSLRKKIDSQQAIANCLNYYLGGN